MHAGVAGMYPLPNHPLQIPLGPAINWQVTGVDPAGPPGPYAGYRGLAIDSLPKILFKLGLNLGNVIYRVVKAKP